MEASDSWSDTGDRLAVGCRRIRNILQSHEIALMRTLEQKISDAGPYEQRVDPHILSAARKHLAEAGEIDSCRRSRTGPWYHLHTTPEICRERRLRELVPIAREIQTGNRGKRIGQALEIAVYRSLKQTQNEHGLTFLGGFPCLDDDDSRLFQKEEPPSLISGRSLTGNQSLDFCVVHPEAGLAGIEVKNTRAWIYPDSEEITETLAKCCALDAVPTIICRRYAYGTYSVLHKCGVLLFQNYNQLYPASERQLAAKASHKHLLGYHDIRVGNAPNPRLRTFIGKHLPRTLPDARIRFDQHKDLLERFAARDMLYEEFAARARRRATGTAEDHDTL